MQSRPHIEAHRAFSARIGSHLGANRTVDEAELSMMDRIEAHVGWADGNLLHGP